MTLTEEVKYWSRVNFPSSRIDESKREAIFARGGNVMKVIFESAGKNMDLESLFLLGVTP